MKIAVGQIKIESNVRSCLGDLASLAGSIGAMGLQQPVAVYPDGAASYVLLFGHRRLEAARALGMEEIEAVVVNPPQDEADRILRQLSENLEQAGLSALDEGRAYQRLVDLGISQAEIARRRGISEATVSQRRKLLTLAPDALEAVEDGRLSAKAGEELARLEPEVQADVLDRALRKPSVRRVKRLVERKLRAELKLGPAPARSEPAEPATGYTTHTACAELKGRLAQQCGLDPGEIMESRLAQYDLLLSQGIGVSLSIGGGTMFQVHLPREILGLDLDEDERRFHDDHVDLGQFFLAEKEIVRELANVEGAARQYLRRSVLERFGFEFEPGWVWVPVVAEGQGRGFHQVKARLEEYRRAYLDAVDDVAYSAEEVKAETLESIESIAGTVYARMNGGWGSPPSEFVENLKGWVEAEFPTAQQIRARGYFQIRYRAYPMPSQIEADRMEAEAETERARMLLDHQRTILAQEREAKEAMLDPMIHGIAERLSSLVGEAVGSVTRALNKGGNLPHPTVQRLRNLVQELGPLNLLAGNADLEQLTARLDGMVRPGVKTDPAGLAAALGELQRAAEDQSRALKPDMMLYLEL